MDDSEIVIGRVVRAHGLRGELVVQPASPDSDVLLEVEEITLDHKGDRTAKVVRHSRPQGRAIVVALEGVSDRNAAEALIGAQVVLPKDDLPPPEAGEFYVTQLIGLDVVSPSGEPLGKVVDFEDGGIQSWLVVESAGKRSLVPFTEPLVRVELEAGRIVLDAPEGLLDGD